MSLGTYDKTWCLKIINDMLKWQLTSIFRNPVDPERDSAPNYYIKVKNPIDLSSIKKKLLDNTYKNVLNFINDIDLIYQNALLFHGENSMITFIAKDISNWIKEKYDKKASSQEQEWEKDLNQAITDLQNHLLIKPPAEINQIVKQTENDSELAEESLDESHEEENNLSEHSNFEEINQKSNDDLPKEENIKAD